MSAKQNNKQRVVHSMDDLHELLWIHSHKQKAGVFNLMIFDVDFKFTFTGDNLKWLIYSVDKNFYTKVETEKNDQSAIQDALGDEREDAIVLGGFEFSGCSFTEVDFSDTTFDHKMRFRDCEFQQLNLRNTAFKELADFWMCLFHKPVIFYKTDFLSTTVFAACTFEQNVLFTYTLIDKLIILRNTTFKQGLDLSLSIGGGIINVFGIILKDYKPVVRYARRKSFYETWFEGAVSTRGQIPTKNKRETYRLLKHQLQSQGNISEALYYRALEKQTLLKELREKPRYDGYYVQYSRMERRLDRLNLWISYWSNRHGTSFTWPLLVLLVAILPYSISFLATKQYDLCFCWDSHTFRDWVGYYFQFLNPTHKVHYISDQHDHLIGYYMADFFGRVIVGFGLYQFVQAFRKFR